VIREKARRVGRQAHHAQSGQVVRSHFDFHAQCRASSLDGRDDRGSLEVSVLEGVLAPLRPVVLDGPEDVRRYLIPKPPECLVPAPRGQ